MKLQNLILVILVTFTMVLTACGGGGGGGGTPLETPIGDVSGDWLIDETSKTANEPECRPPTNPTETFTLSVQQSGNDLTVTDEDGNEFSGTISGNSVTWSGSYPDGPGLIGITTLNSMTATVATSCDSLSGSANWSYAESGFACSGTTQFTGTRTSGSGCGGSPPPNPNTILNGSFETGDYTSWTLSDDSGEPTFSIWANLAAGVTFPAGTLYDHQDGLDVPDSCMLATAFPTSIVSDGLQAGLLTQNGGARHIMTQDVFVESNATSLLWDMAYDSSATLNSTSQYIALNIIDPASTAVLDTPFKLDPVLHPRELATFTTFEVDVTPYRGQTIRIEHELQAQNSCFAVFFDNFRISSNPLPVTSHTFATCSATGATGPNQAACVTAYAGTSLMGTVLLTGGIQRWTAPRDGTYQIDVYGAQGASADAGFAGGLGANMRGDFVLTAGQMLDIVVGQAGIAVGGNGGGGGGSFVVDVSTGLPLIVAGGGGGIRDVVLQNGCDGRISEEGGTGSANLETHTCDPRVGGIGEGGIISSDSWGSAGGGFNTDGATDPSSNGFGDGGSAFVNGAEGGAIAGTTAFGGFGGGGTGHGNLGGGGGGGYSGGDGGRLAGGGGSFNSGAAQSNTPGVQAGAGTVTITLN